MKKLYTLITAALLTFMIMNVSAGTFTVSVGANGLNLFSPTNVNATAGDVVVFVLASGIHDVSTTSVPAGAAPLSSGTMSNIGQTYTYTITIKGNYYYHCGLHGTSMSGGFTVIGTLGMANVATDFQTSVFPNPFNEKLNINYSGIESIEFINIIGAKVKTVEIPTGVGKLEVDFDAFPAGIYFYRTYKDGAFVEIKKIVKTK